jgi:hypothetical protein
MKNITRDEYETVRIVFAYLYYKMGARGVRDVYKNLGQKEMGARRVRIVFNNLGHKEYCKMGARGVPDVYKKIGT